MNYFSLDRPKLNNQPCLLNYNCVIPSLRITARNDQFYNAITISAFLPINANNYAEHKIQCHSCDFHDLYQQYIENPERFFELTMHWTPKSSEFSLDDLVL